MTLKRFAAIGAGVSCIGAGAALWLVPGPWTLPLVGAGTAILVKNSPTVRNALYDARVKSSKLNWCFDKAEDFMGKAAKFCRRRVKPKPVGDYLHKEFNLMRATIEDETDPYEGRLAREIKNNLIYIDAPIPSPTDKPFVELSGALKGAFGVTDTLQLHSSEYLQGVIHFERGNRANDFNLTY